MKHYEKYYSLLNHRRQIPQTDTTSLTKVIEYENRAMRMMIELLEDVDEDV